MNQSGHNRSERGGKELVRFLTDHGHKHVFGLPGSSMVAPLYELQKTDIAFVSAIHESAAVAAADGYARVKGEAMVMLYMVPGLANGMANLYNAFRDETPLIVMASQLASNNRTWHGQIGEHDMVAMARPFTRFAHELAPGMDVRFWLEQARRISKGMGGGPAFLAIPENVFEEPQPVEPRRSGEVAAGAAPDITALVDALAASEAPLIVVGGQLRRYGGSAAIEQLAERHGIALVYEAGFNDRLGVAPGHPNCFGNIMFAPAGEQTADFVLNIGGRHVLEAHRREGEWFAAARFIGHVNADPAKLGAGRSVDWCAAADPGKVAAALLEAIEAQGTPDAVLEKRKAWLEQARMGPVGSTKYKMRSTYSDAVAPLYDALDRGWLVDESVMASIPLVNCQQSRDGSRYVGTTGASLGWATGACAGVALASGEPVTCVLGDGALRFGALGLWTVRDQNLPVTFVIIDNGGYGSTRFFEEQYVARLGEEADPPHASHFGSDFRNSGTSVEGILGGFGIPAEVTASGEDARAAIERAWASSNEGPNAVVIKTDF
jgi:thiamine pyrophosphate-dependent acetolactate synthase large subunit-like protein